MTTLIKNEIKDTLKTLNNKQLTAIYMSLEDGNTLRYRVHRILWERGQTIGGVRKYHNLK